MPPQPYYMTHSFPPGTGPPGGPGVPGSSATLPRGGSMMRAYSPAPKNIPPSGKSDSHDALMTSLSWRTQTLMMGSLLENVGLIEVDSRSVKADASV